MSTPSKRSAAMAPPESALRGSSRFYQSPWSGNVPSVPRKWQTIAVESVMVGGNMASNEPFAGGIATVAIVGSGTMGAQIASLTAVSGRAVRVYDALPEAVERAKGRIA